MVKISELPEMLRIWPPLSTPAPSAALEVSFEPIITGVPHLMPVFLATSRVTLPTISVEGDL